METHYYSWKLEIKIYILCMLDLDAIKMIVLGFLFAGVENSHNRPFSSNNKNNNNIPFYFIFLFFSFSKNFLHF